MITKICKRCNIEKSKEDFYFNKSRKDGVDYWCKECSKQYKKVYCQINKIKISNYVKDWKLQNKEKVIQQRRNYRLKNKEKYQESQKEYRIKHRDKIRINDKKFRQQHKKELSEKSKNNYLKNKITILKRHKNYANNKYNTDINFKLSCLLRNRIRYALKRNFKSISTLKLLGCSLDFLKQHLSSKFTEGMSFDNYGKWHIEHIKPCASFDLSKPEEQAKCFHYTNLQPLWAKDNILKGSKVI